MAFPATALDLKTAWTRIREVAGQVKSDADNLSVLCSAGSADASNIFDFMTRLADYRADLVTYAAVPGLAAYAQQQVDDPSLDIAAEYVTMRDAMDACRDWIIANFPASGGYLQAQQWAGDGSGRQVARIFTAAALSGLVTQLQSLSATIS